MKISLRQVEAFLALAELLSFSRAAERIGMTQAAFSQAIKELEKSLGIQLFQRTTRRVQMLPAAELLRDQMKSGMSCLEAACRNAQALARLEHGQLALTALPSMACGLVLQALGRFKERYPAISLRLYEDHNQRVLERVENGEVELGVGSMARGAEHLEFQLLLEDELVCVLPREHTLAQSATVSWAVLAEESLILVAATSQTYTTVRQSLAQVTDREPQLETLNSVTAVSMVRAGLGLTLVPEINLPDINMNGLVSRRMGRPVPRRKIGIFQRPAMTLAPAAQAFRDILIEETEGYRVQKQ